MTRDLTYCEMIAPHAHTSGLDLLDQGILLFHVILGLVIASAIMLRHTDGGRRLGGGLRSGRLVALIGSGGRTDGGSRHSGGGRWAFVGSLLTARVVLAWTTHFDEGLTW